MSTGENVCTSATLSKPWLIVSGGRNALTSTSMPMRSRTARAYSARFSRWNGRQPGFGRAAAAASILVSRVAANAVSVATGSSRYPTPLGRFSIVVKWRNPWWYPPDSDWARDKAPVPPGPSNPLGTRWMGISSPGVGIHGTPEPGSIGYSVSHGCVRMRISDAEWLFERVAIGTTVFIVAA